MKIKIEIDITEQIRDLGNTIDQWRCSSEEDKEFGKMYTADRKQMTKVLNLLKEGKLKQAYNTAHRLDTILRDNIPDSVWKLLDTHGE